MPTTRHTPTRMCRVCRVRRPKNELERWVLEADQLKFDTNQVLPGRGYYSCPDGCSAQIHSKVALKRRKKH